MSVCTQGLSAAKRTYTEEFLLSLWLQARGQLGHGRNPVYCTAKSIHLSLTHCWAIIFQHKDQPKYSCSFVLHYYSAKAVKSANSLTLFHSISVYVESKGEMQ